MNWLISLVFSGVLFSTNPGTAVKHTQEFLPTGTSTTKNALDETERIENTYPLSPGGRLSVSNVNGSISAEAWDRDEVKMVAVKTADTQERLSQVEIKVNAQPNSISIETSYDHWRQKNSGEGWKNNGRLTVDYQLMVPRGAVLNEIETVNGSVTISNFTNICRVSAVNGNVRATNLRGTSELSTVNGEVNADFAELILGSKISLETVNGKVNLTIPSDANATIKVDSLNGNISNDFGMNVRKGKYVGRDLYSRLGNGDVKIKLDSVNGGLSITRQKDGRPLSPTTDLLNQKPNDDDWDSDNDAEIGRIAAIIDREMIANARVSSKAAQKALKDAQKEIEKARPEIARATAEAGKIAAEVMQSAAVQDSIRQAQAMARVANAAFYNSVPKIEKKRGAFPVKGIPQITLKANGCSVKVVGWDSSEVKYSVTQVTDVRDQEPIVVKEKHDDKNVTIEVEGIDAASPRLSLGTIDNTHIEVYVPRKSNLRIISDRAVRIEGVTGNIKIEGGEGNVDVRDVDGKLEFETTDGPVRVIGFSGELTGRSEIGNISLDGQFSKLDASADSSDILLTLRDNSNAIINASSSNLTVQGLTLSEVKSSDGRKHFRMGNGSNEMTISTGGSILLRNPDQLTAKN